MSETEWEYFTRVFRPSAFLDDIVDPALLDMALNDAGAEGWELVKVVNIRGNAGQTTHLLLVFKRLVQASGATRPAGFRP